MAQRLELEQAALTGEPVTVADGVAVGESQAGTRIGGGNGLVAYRTGGSSRRQLIWFDRSGKARGTVGDPDGSNLGQSPRVTRRPLESWWTARFRATCDLWLLDGARLSRFTFDAAERHLPRSGRLTARGSRFARFGLE